MQLPSPYVEDPEVQRNFAALANAVGISTSQPMGVATVASAATIAIPEGVNLIDLTGSTAVTSITAAEEGRIVTFYRITDAPEISDGNNLKLAGNFNGNANDTLTLICDGTNWLQIATSGN